MTNDLGRMVLWKTTAGEKLAVEELLDKGAEVDSTDEKGQTPLMIAAARGFVDLVDLLAGRGACIDAQDRQGRSALLKATVCRNVDVIRTLLIFGADPDLADEKGLSPRSYAGNFGTVAMRGLFTERGASAGGVPERPVIPELQPGSGAHGKSIAPRSFDPSWTESPAQLLPVTVRQQLIPIPDERGGMGGCLVIHSGREAAEFLKPEWKTAPSSTDRLASTLGPAVALIPGVGTALSAGNLVQIVGSQHLLNGLANGTYTHMLASGGAFYGGVHNAANMQIAGQLQFQQVSGLGLMAPLLIWQVANLVFATMHLQKINERLERIARTVDRIEEKMGRRSLAEVVTACEILDEVCEKYACIGRFTEDMTARMVHVEMEIRRSNRESELAVDRFRELAGRAMDSEGKRGARRAVSLMETEGEQVIRDARLLTGLFREELRTYQLSLMHEMQTAPQNLSNTLRRIEKKIEKHREHIGHLGVFEELKDHAEACVGEMGWFSRVVRDRGLVKKVRSESDKMDQRRRELEPNREELEQHPVYLIWRDDTNVVARRVEPSHSGT